MSQKNYITPVGLQRLKTELEHLLHHERPKLVETVAWAASNGDRSENADYIYGKRRLREIDKRIGFLTSRVEAAEVVVPEHQTGSRVLFGATLELVDEEGETQRFAIVGEDEFDITKGLVSWRSPLAQACLGKSAGEDVIVRTPRGETTYVLEKILYQKIDS